MTDEAWKAMAMKKQSDRILESIKEMPGLITLGTIEKHLAARGLSFEHQHITASLINLLRRGLLTLKSGGSDRQVVTVNDVFTVTETPWPR